MGAHAVSGWDTGILGIALIFLSKNISLVMNYMRIHTKLDLFPSSFAKIPNLDDRKWVPHWKAEK